MDMHPGATSGPAVSRLVAYFIAALYHVVLAGADPLPSMPTSTNAAALSQLINYCKSCLQTFGQTGLLKAYPHLWEMVALTTFCGLLATFKWNPERLRGTFISSRPADNHSIKWKSDLGLLRKHSTLESYETSRFKYPAIRTFYHAHPHGAKLPAEPKPLPLLVFVHGLGGSLAQFNNLLTSLINVGPCFGIDLPGCGLSDFAPADWEAYSHPALVELLDAAILRAMERAGTNEAVLICHSMGCSLAVSLHVNPSSLSLQTQQRIIGLIAICPKASLPTVEQAKAFGKLLQVPTPVFNLWRAWDRRGGIDSVSVSRFVGSTASVETKKVQLRFNEQSKTAVWRRMARGAVPDVGRDRSLSGGLPGPDAWAMISVPLLLVAGESDKVTQPEEVAVITRALRRELSLVASDSNMSAETAVATEDIPSTVPDALGAVSTKSPLVSASSVNSPLAEKYHLENIGKEETVPAPRRAVLKTTILPSPASHGLLYDDKTYRTLSGLIQTFVASHIDERLSLGWQLQHLKDANKWDVKNLAKWRAVAPVSESIGGGVFRALKTLREVDDVHSPTTFVCDWSNKIRTVVDISHENPVYSSETLEAGGIEYIKFPTVSKIPPTEDETRRFIALIDQLREEEQQSGTNREIGVHCHYGFNRTGYFICSYLIERERYGVQQALDEFKARRPPGIRHEHFIDTLFLRYCVGLKRAPTL